MREAEGDVVRDLGFLEGEQGLVVATRREQGLWGGMGIRGIRGIMIPIIPILPISWILVHSSALILPRTYALSESSSAISFMMAAAG